MASRDAWTMRFSVLFVCVVLPLGTILWSSAQSAQVKKAAAEEAEKKRQEWAIIEEACGKYLVPRMSPEQSLKEDEAAADELLRAKTPAAIEQWEVRRATKQARTERLWAEFNNCAKAALERRPKKEGAAVRFPAPQPTDSGGE